MGALEVTWEFQVEEVRVHETEHLFGYDVVMSRESEGRWYPTAIISRQRPLNGLERGWAARWAAAVASGDYAIAVRHMQNIQVEPLDR